LRQILRRPLDNAQVWKFLLEEFDKRLVEFHQDEVGRFNTLRQEFPRERASPRPQFHDDLWRLRGKFRNHELRQLPAAGRHAAGAEGIAQVLLQEKKF